MLKLETTMLGDDWADVAISKSAGVKEHPANIKAEQGSLEQEV